MTMEQTQPEKHPLDDVSREAHEMFTKHQVGELQEAVHIEQTAEMIFKYVEKGMLDLEMPLGAALEKLAHIQGELTGEKEEEERDEGL